mgnify:CR=1 FL=1
MKDLIHVFIIVQIFAFTTIQIPIVFIFITVLNIIQFIRFFKREIKQQKERG